MSESGRTALYACGPETCDSPLDLEPGLHGNLLFMTASRKNATTLLLPTAVTTKRMKAVRRRDTAPEVILRRALHAMGFRFRLHPDLPGRPDIVLPRWKTAIFVHGCFWHQHEGCPRASLPKRNTAFWREKFDRNLERDARKSAQLAAMGWSVLVVWECEITAGVNAVAADIQSRLVQSESLTHISSKHRSKKDAKSVTLPGRNGTAPIAGR